MKISEKIGVGLTNFLYPFMQDYTKDRGGNMPKKTMEYDNYNIQEKYLWFLGDEDLLADFYNTRTNNFTTIDTRSSYYYSNLDNSIRIVHSGLPGLISYSKANLLLSGGVKQKVFYKEKEDEKQTEVLEEILKENKKTKLLTNMIVSESWSGSVGIKISFDTEVSKYPIVEEYSPLKYRSVYKRNRLMEMIFLEEYLDGKFLLEEHYGLGYIKYKLYEVKGKKKTEVSLEMIEETRGLKDIVLPNKMMLAMEKKADKSDYKGIIAEFDALDEVWSQLMDEIRTGRTETYIPEMLMDGRVFNEFRKHYEVVETDLREGGKNVISHNQPNIRTSEYTQALLSIRDNILSNVGLSPITVGIGDNIGANASGDSLEKRELVSLRTRKQMSGTWNEFLEDFYELLLISYYWSISKTFTRLYVEVNFGEYITPNRNEVIANVKLMKDAEIIDDEKALDEIYGEEMTEEEKVRILANLGNIGFEEVPDEEIE